MRNDARPQNLSQVAQYAAGDLKAFDPAVREFLDSWQTMDRAKREAAIAEEPCALDAVQDAYLAALAEHLALDEDLAAPVWTEDPRRFLDRPFFAGGLESLKAVLLVESPPAFRRRLIFISANGLSRPRRDFGQETALNVSNLDV